jgi:hypothetical protein
MRRSFDDRHRSASLYASRIDAARHQPSNANDDACIILSSVAAGITRGHSRHYVIVGDRRKIAYGLRLGRNSDDIRVVLNSIIARRHLISLGNHETLRQLRKSANVIQCRWNLDGERALSARIIAVFPIEPARHDIAIGNRGLDAHHVGVCRRPDIYRVHVVIAAASIERVAIDHPGRQRRTIEFISMTLCTNDAFEQASIRFARHATDRCRKTSDSDADNDTCVEISIISTVERRGLPGHHIVIRNWRIVADRLTGTWDFDRVHVVMNSGTALPTREVSDDHETRRYRRKSANLFPRRWHSDHNRAGAEQVALFPIRSTHSDEAVWNYRLDAYRIRIDRQPDIHRIIVIPTARRVIPKAVNHPASRNGLPIADVRIRRLSRGPLCRYARDFRHDTWTRRPA